MRAHHFRRWQLPVALNRSSLEELQSLPRIGEKRAQAIVAARPFARVEELTRVRGIGARTLQALRPRLRLDFPSFPWKPAREISSSAEAP